MAGTELIGVGSRRTRGSGRAISSTLAVIMLVGTLGYVVRDNFRAGAAPSNAGARTAEIESLSEQSRACLDQGDTAGALEHAHRAVELAPDSLAAQLSLVAALTARGDLDGALEALAVAERLDSEHPGVESARRLLEKAAQ
ncbi:MAG: Flp pilus assembly protein TadD [Chlamydiales bacterium]|jgi:Flp pilus assembly protein TadD